MSVRRRARTTPSQTGASKSEHESLRDVSRGNYKTMHFSFVTPSAKTVRARSDKGACTECPRGPCQRQRPGRGTARRALVPRAAASHPDSGAECEGARRRITPPLRCRADLRSMHRHGRAEVRIRAPASARAPASSTDRKRAASQPLSGPNAERGSGHAAPWAGDCAVRQPLSPLPCERSERRGGVGRAQAAQPPSTDAGGHPYRSISLCSHANSAASLRTCEYPSSLLATVPPGRKRL